MREYKVERSCPARVDNMVLEEVIIVAVQLVYVGNLNLGQLLLDLNLFLKVPLPHLLLVPHLVFTFREHFFLYLVQLLVCPILIGLLRERRIS